MFDDGARQEGVKKDILHFPKYYKYVMYAEREKLNYVHLKHSDS